ncbi:hypothetical protein [Aestuariibaculum sediminum]|uniref:Uncharacterized protein n=1 Tax=Aestuariibaculum sediminum TaxID=2770637 RepID=A0A8J6QMW5_9FLAO|nr:hypothetical protein [Aestuariibaculum sediminum]MBD0833724.1 hypothetical protein [Aestuariibaculum sediminum]
MKLKMKKHIKIIAVFSIVMGGLFYITEDIDIDNQDSTFSLSELMEVAVAQTETGGGSTKCFKRTITTCGWPLYNDKLVCETTGDYKQGEECTPSTCDDSHQETKRCQNPN